MAFIQPGAWLFIFSTVASKYVCPHLFAKTRPRERTERTIENSKTASAVKRQAVGLKLGQFQLLHVIDDEFRYYKGYKGIFPRLMNSLRENAKAKRNVWRAQSITRGGRIGVDPQGYAVPRNVVSQYRIKRQ